MHGCGSKLRLEVNKPGATLERGLQVVIVLACQLALDMLDDVQRRQRIRWWQCTQKTVETADQTPVASVPFFLEGFAVSIKFLMQYFWKCIKMLCGNTATAVKLPFHYIKEKADIFTAHWQLTSKQCSWTNSTTSKRENVYFYFVLNCSFNNLKGGTQIKPNTGLCSSPQTDEWL